MMNTHLIESIIWTSISCVGLSIAFGDGNILSPFAQKAKHYIPTFFHQPLFDCVYCFASFWGVVFFTPIYFFDFYWHCLPFALIYLNGFFDKIERGE